MTGLLRWETGTYRNWLGYAGTAEHWLFQVSVRACPDNGGRWLLASTLPGQRALAMAGDCDELKAEAERLFREWAASIGAVLPDPDRHAYLSTSCLHGNHAYCQSRYPIEGLTRREKDPAQCKFCAAPCICRCHQGESQ